MLNKPKCFSSRPLPSAAREILDKRFDVEYWDMPGHPRGEFLRRMGDKEALLCMVTDKVNDELLAAAPKLRFVGTVSVGYDNIDLPACTKRRIVATNTPGVLDETTADLAWALLMAVSRRIVEGDKWVRSGTWPGWDSDQLLGGDVWGKTLGVIGFGRIGRAVARRSLGFKMRVIYNNRNRLAPELEGESNAQFVDMDTLLRESDFISIHVPMSAETRHLISKDSFEKMKPSAYLINTARGAVIDEAALVEALKSERIAGAAIDVYENEPKVNPGLFPLKNVVITPHIGSASIDTRTKMALLAAENAVAYFDGRRPPNALNADQLGL